jgi:hypothetical protein
MFLVLISVKRPSKPQSLMRPEGLGKFKNSPHIQDFNFACGSVWVWNLVSDINGVA